MNKLNATAEVTAIVKQDSTTSARVIALFAEFKSMANIKAELVKSGFYPSENGQPLGEKAARNTEGGKKWNSFGVIARRYVDVKAGRPLTDEEKASKKADSKAKADKAKADAKKELQGQLKAAQSAVLTVANCVKFLRNSAKGNEKALAALESFELATKKA
jgi:hypothetical protein